MLTIAAESPTRRSAKKAVKFRVSLAYNRGMHKLFKSQSQWELWSEIFLDGHSTRIILGQLPSPAWATKDSNGLWGPIGSTSFTDFVDGQNIRGVLSIVEPFEWEHAGVQGMLAKRDIKMSMQSQADFCGVDPTRLEHGIRFIEEVLRDTPDGKVYVHCKAGRGRSAAAVIAYFATEHLDLCASGPLDLVSAHYVVRQCRQHINVGVSKIDDLHEYLVRQQTDRGTVWAPNEAAEAARLHMRAREILWDTKGKRDSPEFVELLNAYMAELQAAAADGGLIGLSCPDFRRKTAGTQSRGAHTFC